MHDKPLKTLDIHFRVSEEHHAIIVENAKKHGLKVGPFLRMLGLIGMDLRRGSGVVMAARAGIEDRDEQSKTA